MANAVQEIFAGGATHQQQYLPWLEFGLTIRMKGHTPAPSTGWLWRLQVKIHHDWLLAISHDDGFARIIWIGINLLVRNIRGNINKISSFGFVTEF
jgi:hypothetical protein